MNKTPTTWWVLVTDSGHARILEMEQHSPELRQVQELISDSQHQTSRELQSDSSGRSLRRESASGHALQPHSNPHDLAEEAFCDKIVKLLEQAAVRRVFDRLAVLADPKTLGRLRKRMSKPLAARVEMELDRDLVHLPLHALSKRVRAEMGWAD
jgi:protein required for attachment to host cells